MSYSGSLPLLFPPRPLTCAMKKAASSLLSSSSSLTVVLLLAAASLAPASMWPSLARRQDSMALTKAQLRILLYRQTMVESVPEVPGTLEVPCLCQPLNQVVEMLASFNPAPGNQSLEATLSYRLFQAIF